MFPLGKTGGLIEAGVIFGVEGTENPGFRWVKPAASLKLRFLPSNPILPRSCFRWVKPAASLKRGPARRLRPSPNGFPLGKTGGLIEALNAWTPTANSSIRFRWVKPAASLKRDCLLFGIGLDLRFRWVKPAASLKLARDIQQLLRLVFPLGKTGGLIEAWIPGSGAGALYEFPLGKTGGLIEA